MSTHLFRAVGSLVALSVCYWGIRARPRKQPIAAYDPEEGAAEAQGLLQERTLVLMRAGRFQDALAPARRILEAYPDNPVYLRQMAQIQGRLGDAAAEAALWERFLKVSPTPAEAFLPLGDAYLKLGRRKEAIATFERAVTLEPSNADFLFRLGRALEGDRQFDRAGSVYRKGAALNPGDPDLATGWARMELFAGNPAKALALAGGVLARNPENCDALLVQGMACRAQGDYPRARAALEKGLALSPRYGDFMLVLAGVALSEGRPENARALCDRYLALHPGDAQARALRERALEAAP